MPEQVRHARALLAQPDATMASIARLLGRTGESPHGAVVTPIRVLIADDQPLVRAGLRTILQAYDDIEVIAEAGDGITAVARAREHDPDVVLMDIRMPRLDGIQATQQLPGQRIIILTTFNLDQYILDALRAGASGFLQLVACGLSNAEIARDLFITEGTVKSHVSRMLAKLGLRDRVQAAILAYEIGLAR